MEPVGLSHLLVDFGPVMNAQFIEMLLALKERTCGQVVSRSNSET